MKKMFKLLGAFIGLVLIISGVRILWEGLPLLIKDVKMIYEASQHIFMFTTVTWNKVVDIALTDLLAIVIAIIGINLLGNLFDDLLEVDEVKEEVR